MLVFLSSSLSHYVKVDMFFSSPIICKFLINTHMFFVTTFIVSSFSISFTQYLCHKMVCYLLKFSSTIIPIKVVYHPMVSTNSLKGIHYLINCYPASISSNHQIGIFYLSTDPSHNERLIIF